MKNKRYYATTLIAVAMIAGCVSTPKENSALNAAQSSYNSARSNPQVTELAPVELKAAADSLDRADMALRKGQSTDKVNHLAYMAKQQVAIAEEVAKRKAAEMAVANAAAQRNQLQLETRTSEADAANRKVAEAKVLTDQQAAELAAADTNAQRDQALITRQQKRLKELNARETARGMVITLGDVLFGTDKSQLASGGMRNVQKLGEFLKEFRQHNVMIEGFTDSTGSNDYNQKLSLRRANAVRTALIDMGVNSDRIATRGYGEMFPVANNNTAAGRQQNRRVEIIISDNNANIAPR